ncbi:DUF6497 family protein [Aliiroseovarius crassostreae]|uniref:DUF6497 family protein n=1 Tax=Aliiroseovarius crassostreae TaxID=154981 RepID=UPI003C7A9C79
MTLAQTYQGCIGRGGAGAMAAALALTLALPAPGQAKDEDWDRDMVISVPSGQPIEFLDVIRDVDSAVGTALRYRFLAPAISRDMTHVSFVQAADDMEALCQDYVLPWIEVAAGKLPDQIIIVLSDRAVEFGVADPDATQYFEAYRPEDGACFWEGF